MLVHEPPGEAGIDVAVNIGREARHRLREGIVLHGAGPGPAQRGVEIARLLFVVDKIPKHERDRVKRDLLDYCHRDTLAMVRLVETLEGLARVAP
jgi:hypothetical protein